MYCGDLLKVMEPLFSYSNFIQSVSSSSWGLGRAAVCDCCTPWTFLLPFFLNWGYICATTQADTAGSCPAHFPRYPPTIPVGGLGVLGSVVTSGLCIPLNKSALIYELPIVQFWRLFSYHFLNWGYICATTQAGTAGSCPAHYPRYPPIPVGGLGVLG